MNDKERQYFIRTIATFFGVQGHHVVIDSPHDGHIDLGEARNDNDNEVTLTFDALQKLSELVGHKGINLYYAHDCVPRSQYTPGDPSVCELRWKRPDG